MKTEAIVKGFFILAMTMFFVTGFMSVSNAQHSHEMHDLQDPGHWYDTYCCNQRDCAPIPSEGVVPTDEGWRITLNPGDHPMVTEGTGQVSLWAPYKMSDQQQLYAITRDSKDDRFHACLVVERSGVRMRCFYRPPQGF